MPGRQENLPRFFQFFRFFSDPSPNFPKIRRANIILTLKIKGISFFLFFLEFPKFFLLQCPPVLASSSDRQSVTPKRRLYQYITNRGSSRFFSLHGEPAKSSDGSEVPCPVGF